MNRKKLIQNSISVVTTVSLVMSLSGIGCIAYAKDENEADVPTGQAGVAESTDQRDAVPGADAPVSPTNSETHIDISAETLLSPEEIDAAYSKLMMRSKWDYRSATFADVLIYAEQYIGLPYVWGGKDLYRDGGFDCSGFVNWVYNNVCGMGIDSDYTSAASLYYNYCTPISEDEARPGDIVFWKGTYQSLNFISHVGIYCGNGVALDAGDPIGYDKVTDIHTYGRNVKSFAAYVGIRICRYILSRQRRQS